MSTSSRRPLLETLKPVRFPLVTSPNLEEEDDESAGESELEDGDGRRKSNLRSIPDSFVLLQSLRQSRYLLLTTFFAKFASRSRAKNAQEIVQPPHTLEYLGKCDLEFGPHIFMGTRFFQVNYTPQQTYHQQWNNYSQPTHASSQHHSAPLLQSMPPIDTAVRPSASSQDPGASSTDDQAGSPLTSGAYINGVLVSPQLISQMDAAAATDPQLARILQLAANGEATTEQLQTLGERIRTITAKDLPSLATIVPQQQSNTSKASLSAAAAGYTESRIRPSSSSHAHQSHYDGASAVYATASQRQPDIVFEFVENSTERWLLPCDNGMLEKRTVVGDNGVKSTTVLLSTFLHAEDPNGLFEGSAPPKKKASDVQKLHPVTIQFTDVSETLWQGLYRCSNAEGSRALKDKTAVFEEMLKTSASRVYLRHRLPLGPLPQDLEEAITDKFAPRPIMHRDRVGPSGTSVVQQHPVRQKAPDDGEPRVQKKAPTHYKDGTLRFCQACGRTDTISWRRGPGGPGTLCNPCAAKFRTRPEQFQMPQVPWTLEAVLKRQADEREKLGLPPLEEVVSAPPPLGAVSAKPPVQQPPKPAISSSSNQNPQPSQSKRVIPPGMQTVFHATEWKHSTVPHKRSRTQTTDAYHSGSAYPYSLGWQGEQGTSQYHDTFPPQGHPHHYDSYQQHQAPYTSHQNDRPYDQQAAPQAGPSDPQSGIHPAQRFYHYDPSTYSQSSRHFSRDHPAAYSEPHSRSTNHPQYDSRGYSGYYNNSHSSQYNDQYSSQYPQQSYSGHYNDPRQPYPDLRVVRDANADPRVGQLAYTHPDTAPQAYPDPRAIPQPYPDPRITPQQQQHHYYDSRSGSTALPQPYSDPRLTSAAPQSYPDPRSGSSVSLPHPDTHSGAASHSYPDTRFYRPGIDGDRETFERAHSYKRQRPSPPPRDQSKWRQPPPQADAQAYPRAYAYNDPQPPVPSVAPYQPYHSEPAERAQEGVHGQNGTGEPAKRTDHSARQPRREKGGAPPASEQESFEGRRTGLVQIQAAYARRDSNSD